jgi:hypothetical protein
MNSKQGTKGQRQTHDNHIVYDLIKSKRRISNTNQDSPDRRLRACNQMNLGTHRSSITNESKHSRFRS